jgi:hypothetical protein
MTTHTISGNNFHGNYQLQLRGSAEGFELSPAQVRRWRQTLCGFSDCCCGGGYGTGVDADSASIDEIDYDRWHLTPATAERSA